MGTFHVTLRVADRFRERYAHVDALVDTGSTYTALPASLLEELGIDREDVRALELADNRTVEYATGETRVGIDNREQTVLVVFAPDDADPLLGATTLEILGLGIDPVRRILVPVTGLMK